MLKNNFKQIREERGLTNDIISGLTGLSANRLNEIELGSDNPTLDELNALSKFYGLKISDFYSKEPVKQKTDADIDLSGSETINLNNAQPTPQPHNQNQGYTYPNGAPSPQPQQYAPNPQYSQPQYGQPQYAPYPQYGQPQYAPYPQQNFYHKQPKPDRYQKNPKTLNLILLILTALASICFFALPVVMGNILGTYINITFLDFLTSGEAGYAVLSIFYLISLLLMLIYTIISLSKNKVAKNDTLLTVFKIISFSASFVMFLTGMIAIFKIGFSGITVVTLGIVLAIVVLSIISFVKSGKIEDLNAYNTQVKKQKIVEFETKKVFSIVNVILLSIMTICGFIVVFSNLSDLFIIVAIISLCLLVLYILFLSSKSIAGSKFAFVSKIIIACLTFASAVLYIAGLSNLIVSFTGGAPIEVICLLVIPAVSSLATIILTIVDIVKSKKYVEK